MYSVPTDAPQGRLMQNDVLYQSANIDKRYHYKKMVYSLLQKDLFQQVWSIGSDLLAGELDYNLHQKVQPHHGDKNKGKESFLHSFRFKNTYAHFYVV
jgi:hypothetical protein